jgi:hypothetical protein
VGERLEADQWLGGGGGAKLVSPPPAVNHNYNTSNYHKSFIINTQ